MAFSSLSKEDDPISIHPRWRKVLRELWLNKNRTRIVVLSIAVDILAVGNIVSFLPAWNASRVTVREVLAYE